MSGYHGFLSIFFLIFLFVMVYLIYKCVADTVLEIGFSKDKQVSKKKIKRRNEGAIGIKAFLLIHILKKADQKRKLIWISIIWWWIVLLLSVIEACVLLCGFFIPLLFSVKIITLCAAVPIWHVGIVLSFQSYLLPQSRKDPGISTFECGFIAFAVLLGGAYFVIMYALGLW